MKLPAHRAGFPARKEPDMTARPRSVWARGQDESVSLSSFDKSRTNAQAEGIRTSGTGKSRGCELQKRFLAPFFPPFRAIGPNQREREKAAVQTILKRMTFQLIFDLLCPIRAVQLIGSTGADLL